VPRLPETASGVREGLKDIIRCKVLTTEVQTVPGLLARFRGDDLLPSSMESATDVCRNH
jgi:hypothetical protein